MASRGRQVGWVILVCWLQLSVAQAQGQGSVSGDGLNNIAPTSCTSSQHVLLGAPFNWKFSDGTVADEICGYTMSSATSVSQVPSEWWTLSDSQYTFYQAGDFDYNCRNGMYREQLSVVEAQYSIALCRECRGQYTLNVGEVLRWSLAERDSRECPISIRNTESGRLLQISSSSYQFREAGSYEIYCMEDDSLRASVVVVDGSNSTVTEMQDGDPGQYSPLLYTHAALMGITFGILLPLGAFLAHHERFLIHKFTQPTGLLLALAGFVMVLVYVSLAHGQHFRFLIHGVVGLALLLLALLVMPALLLHKPMRKWHRRCGHVVAFFGMGNVLLGLGVLRIPRPAALTLCAIYGIWLVVAITVYVLVSPKKGKYDLKEVEEVKYTADLTPRGSMQSTQLTEMGSRKGSFVSNRSQISTRGPIPLLKNVISDEKMIELRKKSMDPLEALKQREQLDQELGLQHQNSKPDTEPEDWKSKLDQLAIEKELESPDEPDNSRVALIPEHLRHSSPVVSPPCSPPLDSNLTAEFTIASDSSEEDQEEVGVVLKPPPAPTSSFLTRAHTFDCPISHSYVDDSDDNSHSGSLRLTRHSKRAKKTVEEVFGKSASAEPLSNSPDNTITEVQTATSMRERRRKPALVPPIITTTPAIPSPLNQDSEYVKEPPLDNHLGHDICPISSKGVSPARKRGVSPIRSRGISPIRSRGISPIRSRGTSPSPSAVTTEDSVFDDASPRPRKKKVSVAQIEATIFPPTPLTLQPPEHLGFPRSTSFSANQNAFADNAFRSVMKMSHDAIVCANSVGEIVYWSSGAVKMFGYTPGEAIGSSLEMIIPQSYKEKHRKGISNRTEDTLKYIRKHSYAPEEQKHARLYAVHGVAKNGHEFPAEVNVTSFVIDEEIFYTGIISELARLRNTRANSVSSASENHEATLKQRAMAVGAQMKIAHKLRSAEHISKNELQRVLTGSLHSTNFEVEPYQMEQMVDGIMKAGDTDELGVISFVNLIQLLSKHRLYISESGLIARYGKTKGAEGTRLNPRQILLDQVQQFVLTHIPSLAWFIVYILLNLLLFIIGLTMTKREGWKRWAYGCGPVLSMNCVLVLLPTLSSVILNMKNSPLMAKVFPLTHALAFHVIVALGILFWTGIHLLTHFTSFALDDRNASASTLSHFTSSIQTNLFPTITGIIVLVAIVTMAVSSITPLRKLFRFIPFYVIHWAGAALVYLLLILHGVNYYNPSFWKWLLPAAIIFTLERVYRLVVVRREKVLLKCAGAYDDVSRVAIVEMSKPKGFQFEPGQHVMLNLPWIGYFNWQPCHIASGPKEDKLTVYIPKLGDVWCTQAFTHMKLHPFNMPHPANIEAKGKLLMEEEAIPQHISVQFTGPYAPGCTTVFNYKISMLVCGGDGPHCSRSIIKKFLEYRKGAACACGCHPTLTKLYFIWIIPSGNDFEWFTDYLSDLCEDDHLQRYLDIRVFLTNIDSPPDELASVLLQLGLKTAGESCTVRRPSQPQLNNLYHMTSYGVPDFDSLLDYIAVQHSNLWCDGRDEVEFGVYTIGELHHASRRELTAACKTHSKPHQLAFRLHNVVT